ncbi:MAG TPA: TPM domain-containing protein [Dyella sp.]|nr:TPM domain-containing protein [Dyella sp.]
MVHLQRVLKNLFGGWFQLRRCFPPDVLDALTQAVSEGERRHLGELRFVVESRLSPAAAWAGLTPRQRARQLFAQLGVWDTEHNSGVLIYVLLSERRIEIVADRGIAARVPPSAWDEVSGLMLAGYRNGSWAQGSLQGIHAVHALLAREFPSDGRANPDELANGPILL